MKIEGRILTNTIILAAGASVGQLANFIFVIAFARQFGAERLGQYSLAMAVGASICIFVSLGVHDLLTREIGQDPARGQAAVGDWLPAGLGSALTVWTGLALATWLLPISHDLRVVLLVVGAYQIIWQLGTIFVLQFSARGLMIVPSLSNGLHRLMILLLAGSAMMLHAGATTALLALPMVAALTICAVAWQARRAFGASNLRWDVPIIISLLSRARSFFVMSVLGVVQVRIGIILLATIAGNTAVGMYAAADRLLVPIILIEMLLIQAAYPAILRLWSSDQERMREVSARCLRLVLLISIPMSGFVFALRADLIPIVYGENFDSAIAPLAILAWVPIFAGMRALWDANAIAAHLQRQAAIVRTITIVVLVSGALLAIDRHQAVGLAVVVLAAEAIHAALLFALLARHGMVPAVVRPLIGPACAAAIAILSATTVVDQGILLRVSVVVTAMILGLWLFGGVRMHDVRFVAQALNKQTRLG